jgi:hypothetical protein
VFKATAALRAQRGAKLPPIRVITREQFAEETRGSSGASKRDRRDDIVEGALRLVALLPANTTVGGAAAEASIDGVAAYYHKGDKAVTIIDDAASDLADGTYTLSHEFVHALQDQREVLSKYDAMGSRSSDASLAIDALVEGEAVAVSNALMGSLEGGAPRDDTRFYDRLLTAFLREIALSTAPFTHAMLTLPYPVGGRPIASAYLRSGYDGIARFFAVHPLTYGEWVEGGEVSDLPQRMHCDVVAPPLGFKIVANDRFGGAGLLALYTRLGLTGPEAYEAARAWTNDTFTIFGPEDLASSTGVLAWRLGLGDAATASGLAEKLRTAQLPVEVTQTEDELLITGATDPAVLASWTSRTTCMTAKGAGAGDVLPTESLLPRSPYVRQQRPPQRDRAPR